MDGSTQIFGILGNPVHHSKSPIMHNLAFQQCGINAAYLPFHAHDIEQAVIGLRGLSVSGVSVTIPHKEAIMPLLDEVDPVALKIGAVNTVESYQDKGKTILRGTNTDWIGANLALQQVVSLTGKKVLILGAGGSARAIGYGLQEVGARVTLCSRTEARGRALASDLGCEWISLTEIVDGAPLPQVSVVINATSVGMNDNKSLLAPAQLQGVEAVMDIVYAPLETQLLKNSRVAGCKVICGLDMLLYQGVAQFEIWQKRPAPVEEMRKALYREVELDQRK